MLFRNKTIFRTLPSVSPHGVHTDFITLPQHSMPMANQEKHWWRRGKSLLIPFRYFLCAEWLELTWSAKSFFIYKYKRLLDIEFSHAFLVFLQYDWFNAGNLYCLLRCDSRSGVKFLCSASWFRGLQLLFIFLIFEHLLIQLKSNFFSCFHHCILRNMFVKKPQHKKNVTTPETII